VEESPFKGKTGVRRIIRAVGYSIEGLASAYVHEDAFRQEVLFVVLMSIVAFALEVTALSRALMIASLLLVLIVELLNSAIEAAVDRISLDSHRLSKRAKDIGSAAVMISLLNVVVVWALVLAG
jgi:diacylglycerol kinase (ATP)